ncbi:MAG: Zn-dependent hydrolase [Promethearchaeota archaeon]|jgi:glyoxylase-like metal-dependent hydrolase (beta-lactamase superfamily II)|nr:MAG: Zn-dependent hydrolase [Candidatus Lokiarchaeota archaeon]
MKKIVDGIYYIGLSGCQVYLIDTMAENGLVLIDCGMDIDMIMDISDEGFDPKQINHCIITHCHIDHIEACYHLKELNPDVKFYAHEADAQAIEEQGHDQQTAASWYGTKYNPVKLYKKFTKEIETLNLGDLELRIIHTPGHTPGSISVLVEKAGKKILFGQDIHGPFYESFGSNLNEYQNSMQRLLDLEPDILCEGHFGIIKPADEVKRYIKNYMDSNKP